MDPSIIGLYETVAKYGFPFVLFLMLAGSYFGIWEWGKAVRARESKYEARETELKKAAEIRETAFATREAALQHRVDQLMDRMIEAAGLIEKSARRVGR